MFQMQIKPNMYTLSFMKTYRLFWNLCLEISNKLFKNVYQIITLKKYIKYKHPVNVFKFLKLKLFKIGLKKCIHLLQVCKKIDTIKELCT